MMRLPLVAVVTGLLPPALAIADKVVAVEAVASSTATAKGDKFAAWRALDGSTGSAWCEGKADEGVDETLTLTLAEPIKVTRIDLFVGLNGSAKEYEENNRISKVSARTAPAIGAPLVQLAKAAPITTKFDTIVKLDLKTPRTVQVLELGLAGVTRGSKLAANTTCIAEVSLASDKGEAVDFLFGIPADAMPQLAPAVNVLRTAVANCDDKALAYLVSYPFEYRIEAEEASRTVKHKDVKSFVKACKKSGIPPLPVELDTAELKSGGLGRVSMEPSGGDLTRVEMRWVDGSWRLASIEGH